MTTIIDPETYKIRNVKNIKVVHHTVPNEETGEEESRKCVEFTVIGKNIEWNHYLFYEDFTKANSEIQI